MRPGQSTEPTEETKPPISHSKKEGATISAKPQIKHVIGDVTRFMPTALKVKRAVKDSRGRIIKTNTGWCSIRVWYTVNKNEYVEIYIKYIVLFFLLTVKEEMIATRPTTQALPTQMKGDAYELFMKEMQDFI